ncbi:MAG: lysophospholipase L1-like esterase [Kiritimatiellia bacterium]|jgi:lysophospholipase L1-like esterase
MNGETAEQPAVKNSRRRVLGKLALLLFSLLVALIAIELVLRKRDLTFSIENDPNYDRSERYFYPDPARLHPYAAPGEKPGLTVAVIGDSFTNGVGVPYLDKYGVRLEYLLNLNEGVAPAVVHVKAQDGTSTFTHFRFLKPLFEEHGKPDVVILGICLNDTEDENNREEFKTWRNKGIPRPPEGFTKRLCNFSKLATFIYNKKEVVRAMTAHEAYYQNLYADEYSGYKSFVKHIGLIKANLDEQGVIFFAVIWPLLGDLNPATYKFDAIHEKIHGVLEAQGVPYVDLKPTFMGKNAERLQAIPFVDGHPNEIAHRMASETIFKALVEQKIIPITYRPQHASGLVSGRYRRRYDNFNPAKHAQPETEK